MKVVLPPLLAAGRSDRVRSQFDGVDALVVTDLVNVRWLSGFTGSNGWLLVLPDRDVLVTDRRYGDQATDQTRAAGVDADIVVGATVADMLSASSAALRGSRFVGVEAHHMTLADHQRWTSALDGDLVATTGLVEVHRRRKDAAEIARIERAADIASEALQHCGHLVAAAATEELTERDVRDALETRMRELGADGPGYETIVAAGPHNAALPHHRPDHTRLRRGDLVIVDVGAALDGYRSDMTRSFVVGDASPDQIALYDLVLESQEAGLAAVRPGAWCRDIDAACRDLIGRAGRAEEFRHGTGHGVGLVIHEDPFLNASSAHCLEVGDVVTIEPGVYRDGVGGVRIEDLVLVTDDGCRNLTRFAKDSPCPPSPPTT